MVVKGFFPPGPSTRIDGVPVNPRLLASLSFFESSGSHLELSEPSLFHLSRSLTPAPCALVAIEELDEAPAAALLARGVGRPGGVRRLRADDVPGAELVVGIALADDLGDDVRRDLEGELLADRALQVAELDHADLRLRVAQHEAVLGETLELVVHQRDVGDVAAGPGPA